MMVWQNLFFLLCRLLAIAEETLAEFLSKATGTAVDWVQMIGMKVSLLLRTLLLVPVYVIGILITENVSFYIM